MTIITMTSSIPSQIKQSFTLRMLRTDFRSGSHTRSPHNHMEQK
jgi:hypothetical protein